MSAGRHATVLSIHGYCLYTPSLIFPRTARLESPAWSTSPDLEERWISSRQQQHNSRGQLHGEAHLVAEANSYTCSVVHHRTEGA